ncbi:RNA-binding protein 12 [Echinococcus granulosus]|nr:RNA-binding protein 12 [Echinococcus granulosus]
MTSVIIRLQNLPMTANASNIRRFFGGLNIPEGGVHIVGGEKGDAFIAFATDEDARKAMLLDHQYINSAQIRLFLSSKAEMQSVIETARCSVIMASQQPPTAQETVSRPPGQYNPSSHTISAHSQSYTRPSGPPGISSTGGPYAQSSSHAPHQVPSDKGPESHSDTAYGHGYDRSEIWGNDHDGNQLGYSGYSKEQSRPPRPSESQGSDGVFPPHKGGGDGYSGYNGAYEDRPPPPTGDGYYGYGNGYEGDMHYEESGYYRENAPMFPNGERDFSVRPPWLRDEDSHYAKRSGPPDSAGIDAAPYKRYRQEEIQPQSSEVPCLDFVVKVSMRPSDVTVKSVFDLLRGVNIVPKFGIRVEEDALKRYTGNVYCMLTCPQSHHRALACDGNVFRGAKVLVVNSSAEEYFKVTDSSFQSRCPPALLERIPPRASTKPNYYSEGCIEISEIPSDVTERDIVSFLGVPGLSEENVKIVQSGPRGSAVALVRLPSARDLDILLGAPPRPFSRNQAQNVKLMAISAMQFVHSVPRSPQSKQTDGVTKQATPEIPAAAKTCCFIYGFSRNMTIFEISKIFPSVFIPGDSIHLLSSSRAAVIDFINEDSCKTALRDFSAAESELKKVHRNLCMRAISKAEFEQKLQDTESQTKSQTTDSDRGESRPTASRYHHPPQPPLPTPPRGAHPRPPFPPPGPPPPQFRRPGPPVAVSVHISNLPPNCPPNAVLDVFRPFRPLPGSLRFRRDHRGNQMGEALISFGCFGDAERAAHETNMFRLFNNSLSVRIHQHARLFVYLSDCVHKGSLRRANAHTTLPSLLFV